MGYVEILGLIWLVNQVFGNEALMVCVSGCS